MSKLTSVFLFAILSGSIARAQSLNVDFEPANPPFAPVPHTYGAAAQSPGFWNPVSTTSPTPLSSLSQGPTSVVLSSPTALVFFEATNAANTRGADEALLDDYAGDHLDGGGINWEFAGLASGDYQIFTICVPPTGGSGLRVDVDGSPEGTTFVDGHWYGTYTEGITFARHTKTVTDGRITVRIRLWTGHDSPEIVANGIQLVRAGDELTGVPLCFGDGSGAPCPCSNTGEPARGCDNSAGTGGALLTATGAISPDTIVLHSAGELPTALTVFLQGTTVINPVIFGDGLRCAGGNLLRLYVKTASGGFATAPELGDPSITARCTALGQPIPPGHRRYYQAYFRDANPGFCSAPPGGTFNASQALRIDW